MSSTRKHEFELEIGATPEEVWAALTEADGITRWFAPEANVTPGQGGSLTLSWGPGAEGTGPIHLWEPGRRFGWTEGPDKKVEFEIEAIEGGRTRLRMVHSGFAADANFDDEYGSTHGGWLTYFSMLQYSATRLRGQPMRQVHQMRTVSKPPDEVWKRLLTEVGLAGATLADATTYRAQLAGRALSGTIIRHPKPGYLSLATADGMAALFVEKAGPDAAMLTIQWFAAGSEAIAEADAMKAALGELVDRLSA